jgi:hypothetical protein
VIARNKCYLEVVHRLAPLLLASSADMLAKARHDLAVLETDLQAYHLFNFFVTCHHIIDYVKVERPDLKDSLDDFTATEDLQLARFLCNRGKHLELRKSPREHDERLMGARAGIARSGAVRSGEPVRWHVFVDNRRIDPVGLGRRVLLKWTEFFRDNAIPE